MKGDYTLISRKEAAPMDEEHPQMKGDYTFEPDPNNPPIDEEHPQMKGDYTKTATAAAIRSTKSTPK